MTDDEPDYDYGGNGNYTYIITGTPSYTTTSDPQFPNRHTAVGEKAILEAIHPHTDDMEIVVRERHATDEANKVSGITWVERYREKYGSP